MSGTDPFATSVRVEQQAARKRGMRPSRHPGGAFAYLDYGLRPPLDTNGGLVR